MGCGGSNEEAPDPTNNTTTVVVGESKVADPAAAARARMAAKGGGLTRTATVVKEDLKEEELARLDEEPWRWGAPELAIGRMREFWEALDPDDDENLSTEALKKCANRCVTWFDNHITACLKKKNPSWDQKKLSSELLKQRFLYVPGITSTDTIEIVQFHMAQEMKLKKSKIGKAQFFRCFKDIYNSLFIYDPKHSRKQSLDKETLLNRLDREAIKRNGLSLDEMLVSAKATKSLKARRSMKGRSSMKSAKGKKKKSGNIFGDLEPLSNPAFPDDGGETSTKKAKKKKKKKKDK